MLVVHDPNDVAALDGVYVHAGCQIDETLVLSRAHASIDVEGLRAHPPADQLDHSVVDAGRVDGRGAKLRLGRVHVLAEQHQGGVAEPLGDVGRAVRARPPSCIDTENRDFSLLEWEGAVCVIRCTFSR